MANRKQKLKEKAKRQEQLAGKRELKMIDKQLEIIGNWFPDRRCDGCTACCTVMGVTELNKPYYEPCAHLCEGGCGIYKDRPKSCHAYMCGWLGGQIDGERPDKQGLMVDATLLLGSIVVYIVHEVYPGAAETPENILWLDALAMKCGDVVFCKYGEHKAMTWWLTGGPASANKKLTVPPALAPKLVKAHFAHGMEFNRKIRARAS